MNLQFQAILAGTILTATSPLIAQTGRVRIRVRDATDTVMIPDAEASLLGKDERPIQVIRANEAGEIVLTGIPFGDAQIRVTRHGFKSLLLSGIPILSTDELKLDAKLEVTGLDITPVRKRKHWWFFH